MSRVLIIGITGMAGSHLAESYSARGWDVHGTVRERSSLQNLSGFGPLTLHQMDLNDPHAVNKVLLERFDVVHALAAVTLVPYSWECPSVTIDTNIKGMLNILESIRRLPSMPVLHYSSSCEVYGRVLPEEVPVSESQPLRPSSPYAISKLAAEMLSKVYGDAYGFRCILTRAFNHTSVRRTGHFVSKTICRQAAEISLGKRKEFSLGNLAAVRDWTDTRDICRAYMLAVERCDSGVPYNICSGIGHSVADLVSMACEIAGIGNRPAILDPSKLRPLDNLVLVGDGSRFANATGWKPLTGMREIMESIYRSELSRIEGEKHA